MRRHDLGKRIRFSVRGLVKRLQQTVALAAILCLLLPTAAPIPAYAYSERLPKVPAPQFGLTAPDSSSSSWASDFISKLTGGPAAFVTPSAKLRTKENPLNPNELVKLIASVSTEIDDRNEYKVGQVISLAAIPKDKNGNTVNGVGTKWQTEDQTVIRILNDSQAIAVAPGKTSLKVTAGNRSAEFYLKVLPANNIRHAASESAPDDPLEIIDIPSDDAAQYTTSQNNVGGSSVGQNEMQSTSAPVIPTRERPGSSNYSFDVPIGSLPGRGVNASVGVAYNSRVWSRSTDGIHRIFTFNPNENWLSPGFEIGYGDLRAFGGGSVSGYMLTGPDGSRHQLPLKSQSGGCYTFESNDGTFIRATICGLYTTSTITVMYPDGTRVRYGATTASGKRFPERITDRQGNYLTIAYLDGDTKGQIAYIVDTLGRYIEFHYVGTTNKKLISICAPGYNGSSTTRKLARFYYVNHTFSTSGHLTGSIYGMPSSADVLEYIYFPGIGSGYKFEYAAFGSIKKISQRRGMVVSNPDDETANGSVTNSGTEAAWTSYNYPSTSPDPDDVPKFTERQDGWLTSSGNQTATTEFEVDREVAPSNCDLPANQNCEGTITTTIIAPDGTISQSISKVDYGAWDDGMLQETRLVKDSSSVESPLTKTKLFWEQGDGSPGGQANPRLDKIEVTNDAGQTRATSFDYDQYNNQTVVREHDFDDPGDLGSELRRTETVYETGSSWINNRLLRLPREVKTLVGSTVVAKTMIEYDGETLTNYGEAPILQHDESYNSGIPNGQVCFWRCPSDCETFHRFYCECDLEQVCFPRPVYNPATAYRGNVTKIISFPDTSKPANDAGNPVSTMKYDVVGNMIESLSDCCDLNEEDYVVGNHYAYPVSETRSGSGGLSMTTSATYDFNTGVMKTATDENNQTTTVTYNADNLRMIQVDGPGGARTSTEYNDSTFPYHVKATLKLDSTRNVSSWSFTNGRGQNFMNRSQTGADAYLSSDVDFDSMGRVVKSYNHYTVGTLTAARPSSGIPFTEVTERDALGRMTETTLPDGTLMTASYSGLIATVKDQAGKKRRQKLDALGRIVRVDEPTSVGGTDDQDLGTAASPNQPTFYEYDGNDNLVKVTQTDTSVTPNVTQERLFKYDALSRLTHERQVEASPTLDDGGVKGTPSSSKWTGIYKYNTENFLIEGFDARGVKTTFTYDGLNRVKKVEYANETGYATPDVTYTYDQTESGFYNNGRLTKVETALNITFGTPATVHNFRYDKVGQIVKHTTSIGSESYLQEYTYNLAGQLTTQKYPSGKVVTNSIDNYGRLSTVADAQRNYLIGVTFNSQGLPSQLNLGNGNHETFSYNNRFQMESQSLMKSSSVLQKYDYSYGTADLSNGTVDTTKNNGQLGKIEGWIGSNKQWSQRFGYDELGRLKEAREYREGNNSYLSYKQVFDFDRFGNLYRKTANNPTIGQEDPLPYTAVEATDIDKTTNRFTTNTTYNEAGQVVNDAKFRSKGFAYDANSRMVKATENGIPDAWTVYDALGNRVAVKVNDVWTFMIYDAFGKLAAEYGQADEGTGGVSYIQQDWQGSVRTITNSSGFVTSRTDHQAFGEPIGAGVGLRSTSQGYWGTAATRQGYGMTERDEATGLDHTWFRKHEGFAGRWTSPDPYKGSMDLGDPQSFNRYSYVGSQPTNFIDPSGLMRICWVTSWLECGDVVVGDEEPSAENSGSGESCDLMVGWRCQDIGGGGGGWRPVGDPGGGGGGGQNPVTQLGPCPQLQVPSFGDLAKANPAAATLLQNTYGQGAEAAYNNMSTYERAVLLNTAAGASARGVDLSNARFQEFYRSTTPGNLPFGIRVSDAGGRLRGRFGSLGAVEIRTAGNISTIDLDLYNPLSGIGNFFRHLGEVRFNKKHNRPTHPGDVAKQLTKRGYDSGVRCT